MSAAKSPLSLSRAMCLDESPPLKRKRPSSTSTPDIRRKLLTRSVELQLDSVSAILKENEKSEAADCDVSLDEIDVCPVFVDEESKIKDEVSVNKVGTTGSPGSPKLSIDAVEWVRVLRTKRKSRFYRIKGTDEEDEFRTVQRAVDHDKVPACINGRKPFTVVPGVEYGLEEEVAGGDELADEKEIEMINKQNYLLNSFVCDVGYLSDDELNETPCQNKTESKVRRLRRANTIKGKRKLEPLAEPEVIGPFWWTGGLGCKKELKKWQSVVFSTLPVPTSFSRPGPVVEPPVETVAATTNQEETLRPPGRSTEEEYERKYHIKYLVKSLVQERMRAKREVSPQECSTPLVRRPQGSTKVTLTQVSHALHSGKCRGPEPFMSLNIFVQEDLLNEVSRCPDSVLLNNPETVRKYVTKYRHKFSYQ